MTTGEEIELFRTFFTSDFSEWFKRITTNYSKGEEELYLVHLYSIWVKDNKAMHYWIREDQTVGHFSEENHKFSLEELIKYNSDIIISLDPIKIRDFKLSIVLST